MKKKIMFLIALVAVILSFGYSAKAETCTYDESTMWPSKFHLEQCRYVCKVGTNNYTGCTTFCESKSYGLAIDKDCYCTKLNQDGAGNECYRTRIVSMLKERKFIESDSEYVTNKVKNETNLAKDSACKAIAGCIVGTTGGSAEQQIYNNTYNNCMDTSVTCDTFTVCGQKLCESKYKGNVFCETGIDSENFCDMKEKKDINYSYGAGRNGTKGSITEDLDYISKITVKNCFGFGEIVYYTSLVIKVIQITAPIILIIWASIDLFKSMIAGDEKKIVEMRKPIISRFLSAAAIFLVPWLVSTIVNNFSSNADWLICWKNNRYTYARNDDDYKGSGYVNSVHNQSSEKMYINYSCTTQCHGKNITNCKELCMNTYWESSINCADAYPTGISNPTKSQINDAKTTCYDEFAKNAVQIIKDKNN